MNNQIFRIGVLSIVLLGFQAVFAGPEQDFDAAFKAGKPLTAEAAYLQLVKDGAQIAPIRHFQAADVANQLGKGTLRKDRLMLFVRLEKAWKPEVEQALWYLAYAGAGIDYYERLAANVKPTMTLWSTGYGMLTQFNDANRPREVLRLADILLTKFTEQPRREAVMNLVYQNSQRMGEGYPERDLCALVMKHPGLGTMESFGNLIIHGSHRKAFWPEFAILYAAKHGDVSDWVLNQQVASLDNAALGRTTNVVEIADRDMRAENLRKVRKLCFDGKHPESAWRYFRVANLQMPKLFYKTVATNGYVAGACAMYKELVAQPAYKADSNYRRNVINTRNEAFNLRRFSPQEIAGLVDDDPSVFDLNQLLWASSLGDVVGAANKEKSPAPVTKLAQKYPTRADEIYRWAYDRYVNCNEGKGDAGMVKRIFADIAKVDRGFGYHVIDWTLNGCKSMSVADKVAMFKSAYVVTGFTGSWKELKKRADAAKDPKTSVYADPAVKAFAATIKEGDLPGDPIHRLSVQIAAAKGYEDIDKLFADLNKTCPSKYGESKAWRENSLVGYYFDRYRDLAWGSGKPEAAVKYVACATQKMSKNGPDRNWMNNFLNRAKDGASWEKYYRAVAAIDGTQDALSNLTAAKDADKPVANVDMRKMKPQAAYDYMSRNVKVLKKPANYNLYFDFLAAHPLESHSPGAFEGTLAIADGWSLADNKPNDEFLKRFPLEKFEGVLFSEAYPKWSWESIWKTMRLARRMGKLPDAVGRYAAWAAKRDSRDRLGACSALATLNFWMPPNEKNKNGWWEMLLEGKDFADFVKGPLSASVAAYPEVQAGALDFNNGQLLDRLNGWRGTWSKEESKDEAGVKAVDLILAGARNSEGLGAETIAWHAALDKALKAKDPVRTSRTARKASQSIVTHRLGGWIGSIMKALDESGNKEAYYLYVDGVAPNQDGWLVAAAAKARGALASSLPGIYPVGEKDPAYPLYVAADELSKKNSERAWQILKEPKNQTVFEREVMKLPPDFVVWGVEQLRMERGDKDELLLKARQIATAIIAQESKVSPEVVAAMILSRAEGYRDQQNFEAAKLEYQSIRDNATYHGTKYGKKAMFRAVDLQIATGNAQAVESILEYWLSQNDREIQAEAHYFLAKLAFDRKDYDECIKQLRQVFAINFTHTEARFLQGEWKLATNSEVDDTEVLVGKLGDRNMIKPGNSFTITVQDANLSVAGGGASIPVIVRTKPGNDEEHISLYPTSRDPSNFKGIVEVILGKAMPSNRFLEVSGRDTVSYVIDPRFLKERGLPLTPPKELRIVDDGKLAIGAGAPRTEEKKTEKGVKDLLEEDNASGSGVSQQLRPGNPLYIVVQDRDRSLGGEGDAVRVKIETTSGDRIEGFELKEEKPFTGVFRGKIETSLPPPRAYASDTAAGLEPGDVINANKKGGWKSLSDGQPGKWFAVDTMGSHLFSEIDLETPSAADIKSIKLVGRMGNRDLSIGQLPAAPLMSKLRLRRQQQYGGSARSLPELRAFCQTDKAPKAMIVSNVQFRALQNHDRPEHQTAFFKGPFDLPEGIDNLRLVLLPKSTKKDALRNLMVTIAIDGEEIFSGQGMKLQSSVAAVDITPGCHQFEMAVSASTHADDFDLCWEPVGREPELLPADWFDEEAHGSLTNFVKDLARIVKTETGFKAVFEKPSRLRTFRWEFADLKSPEVAVTRISAKNGAGEAILPVQTDFSESRNNQTLEVAPGDRISVVYQDEVTSSGEKKVLQRQMSSSFNDAKVRFIFEDTDDKGNVTAFDALRFIPGDALVLSVTDPDCDTTDEADKVEVTITDRSGRSVKKTLLEYSPKWNGGDDSNIGMHSGVFMGVIKTCHEGNTNAPAKVLRVKADDLLTVSYEDRENTNPGVPCDRTARIFAARPSEPELTLFDVRKTQEVDTSADARTKLERIRRRPGNENVQVVYRDVLSAEPMEKELLSETNAVLFNVSAGSIPVRVNDRSRARHTGSRVRIEAVAHSEIARAEAEGRDPEKVKIALPISGSLGSFRLQRGAESVKQAQASGTFAGAVRLSLGPLDPNVEVSSDAAPVLCVTGSDLVDISVLDEKDEPVIKRTLKLVSDGQIGLMDSSFSAERLSAHIGESFFVMVDDADRDATDDPDKIEIEVASSGSGVSRKLILSESMPHSGVFTGRLRPVMFAPGETIPSVATGGVATANETLTEERFAVRYGDKVIFRYRDEATLPWTSPRTLATTGTVFRGANGSVRLFSKRFTDRDTAVLVQFRLAECLFEQAKEHRKLKQPEKSAAAIAEGKYILEEALKNYPDSSHVVQGEYLLANLYQELGSEQKEAGEMEKAIPLYQEALSRFSQILGTWPDSEYAARSQYHKAFCLEMLKDYNRASEEYVKMTYLYPESELVSEATIRLAQYYYMKEKRYDIAGHIYRNFQQRFPQHPKAPRVLFMAGSCYIKQAEAFAEAIEKARAEKKALANEQAVRSRIGDCYKEAVKTFDRLVETYHDSDPKLRAQALYWAGDVSVRVQSYTKAYQFLKRTVFEFPETEWARRARGLLLQEGQNFKDFE